MSSPRRRASYTSPRKNTISTLPGGNGSPSKKQRVNFSWKDDKRVLLLNLCLDFKQCHGHDQSYRWPDIAKSFSTIVGSQLTTSVCLNQYNAIKADYSTWKELNDSATGLGIDPETGVILAEPSWWDKKVKENRNAKKFRTKPLPKEIEDLCAELFDGCVSMGDRITAPGMGVESSNAQHSRVRNKADDGTDGIPIEIPPDFNEETAESDPESVPPVNAPHPTVAPAATTRQRATKGRSAYVASKTANSPDRGTTPESSYDRKWDLQLEALNCLNSTSGATSVTPTSSSSSPTCRECVQELYRICRNGAIDGKSQLFTYALSSFKKDSGHRETFMAIEDEKDKVKYLQHEYEMGQP